LVSQFATLADRLGIRVPPHLLQSLLHSSSGSGSVVDGAIAAAAATLAVPPPRAVAGASAAATPAAGATFDPQLVTSAAEAPWNLGGSTMAVPSSTLATSHEPADVAPPPALRELENVAKAAIAAVNETRKRPSFDTESFNGGLTVPDTSETPAGEVGSAAVGMSASAPKVPAYSKRRKKPRLADCETKLAELQAENEVLKRHLTTISNQNHKIDAERKDLERKMRAMLETGAVPQEMDQLVQTFSDYYSDYGKRRGSELEFHLEQLQRLANPTNVTKMGLWTLGQQSSNPKKDPIAGMLQRELGITPQQGKKILEQRQKIRDVCTNLSEVRVYRLLTRIQIGPA
jgi:hypothetical protein